MTSSYASEIEQDERAKWSPDELAAYEASLTDGGKRNFNDCAGFGCVWCDGKGSLNMTEQEFFKHESARATDEGLELLY
jgi:hypothetical protein